MSGYSTNTVCGMTGANRANLRRWQHYGLVSKTNEADWSDKQLSEVFLVVLGTSNGLPIEWLTHKKTVAVTLSQDRNGWSGRDDCFLTLLESCSDREVWRYLRNTGGDVIPDEFINAFMRPLYRWLSMDELNGADERLERFHLAVLRHYHCVKRDSTRHSGIPLLLEKVSGTDATEIWLEAIRLTGQGFIVDVCEGTSTLSGKFSRYHEHHLLWCGAGISPACLAGFYQELDAGVPVMLCGPDSRLRLAR